jgi:predicted metalloprotease with PDZ domain
MRLHYTVSLARPNVHLLGIEVQIEGAPHGPLRVSMPEWIPGHYSLMNNARFVQDLRAFAKGREVPAWKVDKQTWEVEAGGAPKVTVRYDLFARTLSSGASSFDDTQCHINGGNAFLYVDGHQDAGCTISFRDKPRTWKVATGLVAEGTNRWSAPTYDDFIDCPVKVAPIHHETFRVRGKAHHVVVSDLGDSVRRLPRLVKDIKAFVTWLADMFQGLPYEDYWFLFDLHPGRCKGGALEHKNSTHLALPIRLDSDDEEDYERIVAVACHEYFHTWNVKRIRPRPLGPFDYKTEQHTTDLWIAEGLTDYYTYYALQQAGVFSTKTYLKWVARYVDNLHDMPGRNKMSIRESSWDTWTQSFWNSRLAFEDTNSLNRYVDYYTKGSIVGAMLDVEIRAATEGRKGLEDVFRALWRTADLPEGFEQGEFEDAVERIAGRAVRTRLERWVGTPDALPYAAVFAKAGLRAFFEPPTKDEDTKKTRRKILGAFGIEVNDVHDPVHVRNVDPDSPAAEAGLDAGDVVLALDGRRVTKDEWRRLFREAAERSSVEVTFFRQDQLRTTRLRPRPDERKVTRFEVLDVGGDAKRVRDGWLGKKLEPFTTGPARKDGDAKGPGARR